MELALTEITEAICEIAEGNAFIDFEEFLDVLQQINIDPDDENNNYNKSKLNKYFCALLKILHCDSNELNIEQFHQYINQLQHINSFTKYANPQLELSAFNYMKYLIDCVLYKNKKNKNKHRQKHKHKKRNDIISTEKLLLIAEELSEYLEDEGSTMDYQDFIGWCREFLPNHYPQNHIKLSFEFIVKHEKHLDHFEIDDIEISVSFFVEIIAKYGDNKHELIGDIIANVFDVLSATQLKHRQSQLIKDLRHNLQKADSKQCGMISLEEFISGLKASNVKYISKRDMKKIFAMSTTNGSMKINLFMERFNTNNNKNNNAMDVDELFLNAFEGIISRKKKKKKKKKKKSKKQKIEIESVSATELSQIAEEEDIDIGGEEGSKLQDGFSKLQVAFAKIDENEDNYINFSEFMAVIVGDLKMNLTEIECKQIYFHQPLSLIKGAHYLDLNDLMDQLYEEYLSFPEGTADDLLRKYFSKILQEAAPFERLNEFILDYIDNNGNSDNKSIHNEIISCYGTMSSNPLLRRVHKQQRFEVTIKYRDVLAAKCTPAILRHVIKSIRSDSALKEKEIKKMYDEWLICLNRQHLNHKFSDLFELDFLLFHLGLIVSKKLSKRFTATFLNTVYEDEEIETNIAHVALNQSSESLSHLLSIRNNTYSHLIPSFMKTIQETNNLLALNQQIKEKSVRITREKTSDDNEEKDIDDYQQTKKEFVNQIASELSNVEFKLIDLIGEFIDDDDNTISIKNNPNAADLTDIASTPQPQNHHKKASKAKRAMTRKHKRARSELLLSKMGQKTKSILQRRKERIQKTKQTKLKRRRLKRSKTTTAKTAAMNKYFFATASATNIGSDFSSAHESPSLSSVHEASSANFTSMVAATASVPSLQSLTARMTNHKKIAPQVQMIRSVSHELNDSDSDEEDEILTEITTNFNRDRVGSLDASKERIRSDSIPTEAMSKRQSVSGMEDIDLVSSENRWRARARTTSIIMEEEEDEDEDDDDSDEKLEMILESVTSFTPQTSSGSDDVIIPMMMHIDSDNVGAAADDAYDEEEDEEEEIEPILTEMPRLSDLQSLSITSQTYDIIGQEKVNFDPLKETAIYDPVSNILKWSNGTKWIKKDFQIFKGKWRDPHGDIVIVDENGLIHYVEPKLGTFQSRIIGFYKIAIHFQSNIYQARLSNKNTLNWDNGTVWKRVGDQNIYFLM